MVFSSLPFLFRYLPIVLILYFIAPRKYRNAVLFFTSLVFYAWGEPIYFLIMLFSTLVDYTHGMLVHNFKQKGEIKKAKLAVASSMIINLLILGFFKYSDFAISNINAITGSDIALLKLALPIGISFYTFQTMSYTIDVFRGEADVQRNIISFGAYVVLFPQLIAGPIVQFKTIATQLKERREDFDQFSYGVLRFIIGLGKKVLLANNIGILWDQISATPNGELTVVTAWLGITAFAFQIYFDFSGYSDMAIGLGNMLGFQFLENFNYPYMSKSITEFWRRWHISLGTWFRDYVYIPLGGNRCGLGKQIRNIAIVWFLTGFWHGASWNFIMWGVYFGVILIIEKFVLLKFLNKLPSFLSHIYALVLVWIGWAIFAFDDLSRGINYIKAMFGVNTVGFINDNARYLLMSYALILIVIILGSTDLPKRAAIRLVGVHGEKKTTAVVQGLFIVGIFIISVAYLVDASYNPFLYFRF
jgi:alginate O-acetyltransferase complex protein AlgI